MLNRCSRPIANKYHEGKMKRTLKRELKVPEIAEREADGIRVQGKIATSKATTSCKSASLSQLVWSRCSVVYLAMRFDNSIQPRKPLCAWWLPNLWEPQTC